MSEKRVGATKIRHGDAGTRRIEIPTKISFTPVQVKT